MVVCRSLFWLGKPKERLSGSYLGLGNPTVSRTGAAACVERRWRGHEGGSDLASRFYPLSSSNVGDTEIVPRYLHNSRSRGSAYAKRCGVFNNAKSAVVFAGNRKRSRRAGELKRGNSLG